MRRTRRSTRLDDRYKPLRLDGPSDLIEFDAIAARFRHWAYGIAFSSAIAIAIAYLIRGFKSPGGLPWVAGIGVSAFVWSYLLIYSSNARPMLERASAILWTNAIVILVLTTAVITSTGAGVSPFFWLYLAIIITEVLEDRRRGLVAAWGSWAAFCVLVLTQGLNLLPARITGVSTATHPLGVPWLFHTLGIVLWYFIVAIAVTRGFKWTRQQAQHAKQEQDAVTQQSQALDAERAKLQSGRHEVGERILQLDKASRDLAAEKEKWDRDKKAWDLERAQRAQQLTDQDTEVNERARRLDTHQSRLQAIQQQLDEQRETSEQERARAIHALDDREASLRERTQELEDVKRNFESQRAQTTQSLTQLEETLLASLKRIGDETAQLEAYRRDVEDAQRAFSERQAEWLTQQTHDVQELDVRKATLAGEAQRMQQAREVLEQETAQLRAGQAEQEQAAHRRQEETEETRRASQEEQQAWEMRCAQREAQVKKHEEILAQREAKLEERQQRLASEAQTFDHIRTQLANGGRDVETRIAELNKERHSITAQKSFAEAETHKLAAELQARRRVMEEQRAQLEVQRSEVGAEHERLSEQGRTLESQRQALVQEQQQWERQRHDAANAVKSPRGFFVQQAKRALQIQAQRLREQGREITQARRETLAREQAIDKLGLDIKKDQHGFEQTRQQFEAERQRLTQQLRQRETELAERLHIVGETEQRVKEERVEIEKARRQVEREADSFKSQHQHKTQTESESLRKAREEVDTAQNALAEARRTHEAQLRRWDSSKAAAEETVAGREHRLTEQMKAFEERQKAFTAQQKDWEKMQGRASDVLSQENQKLTQRVQQLEERQSQMTKLQQQLEEQRRQIESRQREAAQAVSKREEELGGRMQQIGALQKQIEGERAEIERERGVVESQRQELNTERQRVADSHQHVNQARHELAEASVMQPPDRFSAETLTLLANEFNAPLASVDILLAGLLEGDHGKLPAQAQSSLEELVKSHAQLRRVVVDVLDIARIERKQMPVAVEAVPLQPLLDRAIEGIAAEAKRKGVAVKREGIQALAVAVDPALAERILGVVLRNAVQYTERGTVTIGCTAQQDRVAITVADTGVGIQAAQLGELFAKPKLGALLHGRGLSLYLARSLAKLMGSDVMLVSSELDTGSTFAVTWPKAPRAAAVETVSASNAGAGR